MKFKEYIEMLLENQIVESRRIDREAKKPGSKIDVSRESGEDNTRKFYTYNDSFIGELKSRWFPDRISSEYLNTALTKRFGRPVDKNSSKIYDKVINAQFLADIYEQIIKDGNEDKLSPAIMKIINNFADKSNVTLGDIKRKIPSEMISKYSDMLPDVIYYTLKKLNK